MSGQIDYFEIGTPDPDAARAFYGGLFGWSFDAPSPQGYSMVDEARGGLWDTSATIAVPLVDNGTIEFAHLVDPSGSHFVVWRPKDDA